MSAKKEQQCGKHCECDKCILVCKPTLRQLVKLVGTNNIGSSEQGYSVSLSADASTLAVGAPQDNDGIGCVYIFVESGGIWIQQAQLIGLNYIGTPGQGNCVALNQDGNTLAFGGSNDNDGIGAVWVFTRAAGTWAQQGDKIVGQGYIGQPAMGSSCALSDDGNTLAFGGYFDNAGIGATWIYRRILNAWLQNGPKLVGTGAVGHANQGSSVSLSSDANILAVGGTTDDTSKGAVWIFKYKCNMWVQQAKLVVKNATIGLLFGYSVSLDDTGKLLSAGAPGYQSPTFGRFGLGAAYVFEHNCKMWSEVARLSLVDDNPNDTPGFGFSVSVSGNAKAIAVGAPGFANNSGVVLTFKKKDSTWQQDATLVPTNNIGAAQFGYSVSFPNLPNVLAIGGIGDNNDLGATWIFQASL